MRAIVFTRYGPPEVLRIERVARPVPAGDQVLIRVRAATVATADHEVRSFTFPAWLWLPLRLMFGVFRPRSRTRILGQELAGDVEAVGESVTGFTVGDPVFVALNGFGAHAEYVRVPESSAMALKPPGVPYDEAACVTAFGLVAWQAIERAAIRDGEHVLVNGAGGGIGTIAVQLARNLGAEVTAVDAADKLNMLRSIGAHRVLDYRRTDFTAEGRTYDVVLDVHGRSPFSGSMRCLRDGGRYVLANPMALSILRGLWRSATGGKRVLFALGSYRREDLRSLGKLVEAGKVKPVIDRRYRLEQAVEAHRYVASGRKRGNVVLVLDGEDRSETTDP